MNRQKSFLIQQLLWVAAGFVISLAISFIVPSPYSLGVIMIAFLAISFAVRALAIRRIKRDYLSSASFSHNFMGLAQRENALELHCMVCGTSHNMRECPKCGSRAVRAS